MGIVVLIKGREPYAGIQSIRTGVGATSIQAITNTIGKIWPFPMAHCILSGIGGQSELLIIQPIPSGSPLAITLQVGSSAQSNQAITNSVQGQFENVKGQNILAIKTDIVGGVSGIQSLPMSVSDYNDTHVQSIRNSLSSLYVTVYPHTS